MASKEIAVSFLVYVALAAALTVIMFVVSHVPAAKAALDVFIG